MSAWRVEALSSEHVREEFRCGVEALDRYLCAIARQDVRRDVAAVFVLREEGQPGVLGYYTLSAYALEREELPEDSRRKLPPHQRLPAILLGRLAIDKRLQGRGAGSWLMADALGRCVAVAEQLGALCVVVHASDETVVAFYRRFGFEPLLDHPLHLFLPMATVRQLLR